MRLDTPVSEWPEADRKLKIKLWAKFINHQYAAWSALFELTAGFKPPKLKEISAVISGHWIEDYDQSKK